MFVPLPFSTRMSGQKDERPSGLPLPIVYENVPLTPPVWEYDVLTIDTREDALPDAALLNEKGSQGWLLVAVVEHPLLMSERTGKEARFVHYYFVRQKAA